MGETLKWKTSFQIQHNDHSGTWHDWGEQTTLRECVRALADVPTLDGVSLWRIVDRSEHDIVVQEFEVVRKQAVG